LVASGTLQISVIALLPVSPKVLPQRVASRPGVVERRMRSALKLAIEQFPADRSAAAHK
jgi:hypothetical protein